MLDLLTRLVDKSLVVAEAQPDGTARYRLLETLRQYAGGGDGLGLYGALTDRFEGSTGASRATPAAGAPLIQEGAGAGAGGGLPAGRQPAACATWPWWRGPPALPARAGARGGAIAVARGGRPPRRLVAARLDVPGLAQLGGAGADRLPAGDVTRRRPALGRAASRRPGRDLDRYVADCLEWQAAVVRGGPAAPARLFGAAAARRETGERATRC